MMKIAASFLLSLCSMAALAYEPQEGDIVFQTSTSSQSLAIQKATSSPYSHMGVVLFRQGKPYVFEAIAKVSYTSMADWIKRGKNGTYVAKRLKTPLTQEQIRQLYQEARRYENKPYDMTFDWSDVRMYCSELVWKMYRKATGLEIGRLQQIKDFNLNAPEVQLKMKERYGNRVPLDHPVISPVAMFNDPQLQTLEVR